MGGQGSAFGLHRAQTFRFPVGPAARDTASARHPRFDFSPIPSGRSNGQHPRSLDTLLSKGTRLARALTMRVYEAKMVYSLISLGEEVRLDTPAKVAEYLLNKKV